MKRAVIVGMGDISSIHLAAIRQNPRITLAAVCDIDETAKARTPDGADFYTDYMEMFQKEKPDVAHICLPHDLHVPVSEAAAELGIHVFCEKPVALDREQAEAFAAFEAAHPQIYLGVCLQNRLNETVEKLKELLQSKEYGEVTGIKGLVPWARSKAYYESKPWRGSMERSGGGCLNNQSIHTLDLMYYLGGEISQLRGSVWQLLDYGIEVEDTANASLLFQNGARGLFWATNANYKNQSVEISVQTEKAEFLIRDNILYRVYEDGRKERLEEDQKFPGTKFYYGASHGKIIGQFYRAIEEHTQDYIHVRDAVMSMRLIDAIRESGRNGGKTVSLN